MAKVADVKLKWTKSASADVNKVKITVTNDGTVTETELGPEVQEFMIEVGAGKSFSFSLMTFDSEGRQSTAADYSFTFGDLEDPLPPMNLSHEIVGVRDVP
jgi:hypothetical protein